MRWPCRVFVVEPAGANLDVVDYGDAICTHGMWERSRQAIYDRVIAHQNPWKRKKGFV